MTLDVERLTQRLLSKVRYEGNCWLWTAGKVDGYGVIGVGSTRDNSARVAKAHRVSYETFVGPIPDGLVIDHLCRTRSCINPAHLAPVTRRENTRRGTSPAGIHSRKTHCSNGHEFTAANTRIYGGRRCCKRCQSQQRGTPNAAARREAGRRYEARQRALKRGEPVPEWAKLRYSTLK